MACAFFFDAEPGVHALDACALCTKPLARDSDIFMYRVDTPFCSDECRHEQMQLDAACARQAAARRQKQFSSGTGVRTCAPGGVRRELTGESGMLRTCLSQQDRRARRRHRPWPTDQRGVEKTRLG
ncbi:hypothetical protein VPH35_039749 [Triticum aestivum]|uniref:FLZ-type domain-containing protein n=1 Tax=Triticum aestivum TaxID=4565 RepID=A0A3B6DMS6_WHEAT|nr:FCS-Like Zinc finger 1-like [Triticum aestivum]